MSILHQPDPTDSGPKGLPDKPDRFVHPEGRPPGPPTPNDPGRRCVRIKKDGNRCRHTAIPGGTVCKSHGGLAPQIANAAQLRLQSAANRMAEELLQVALDDAFDGDPRHRTVRLAAINSALDRAGVKPTEKLELGGTKPFEALLGKALVKGISEMSREESRKLREVGQEPIDAEVVEETPFQRLTRMGGQDVADEGQDQTVGGEAP